VPRSVALVFGSDQAGTGRLGVTRMRRRVAVLVAAGMVGTVGALVAGPASGAGAAAPAWSQSGGGPGGAAAITAPGNLSPATVNDLALDYSIPLGEFVTQSPAWVDGTLYAGTQSGRVLAIGSDTGRTQWSRRLCDGKRPAYNGSEETSPAVGSGAVFVLGDGGVLTGIRLAAPHAVFACVALPGLSSGNGWSPTIAAGVVYAATDSRVVAVDAGTGGLLWTRTLPAGYSVASNVVVDGGAVYVAANSGLDSVGHVLSFRASDGHPRWALTRAQFVESLAAAAGRVITGGGRVQAWDEASGASTWTSSVQGADAVTVSGARVLVAGEEATDSSGDLVALSLATGTRLWRTRVGSEEESQPSAGGGVSYLVDLDSGAVVMNRLSDGHLLAVVSHPGASYDELATPVVVAGHIYVFTQSGSSSQLDRWSASS
jgi:eukaryotic-like serine/threonine-protein kinase